jgi:hypothetical protein
MHAPALSNIFALLLLDLLKIGTRRYVIYSMHMLKIDNYWAMLSSIDDIEETENAFR